MIHNHPDIEEVLIDEADIEGIVERLGAQITKDYAGKSVVIASVLKGAFMFMSDLVRKIELPCSVDFMIVSSYGNSTESSGVVTIVHDLTQDIKGKHVIIAEDVIDSGLTLARLIEMLKERGPASIEVAAFVMKDVDDRSIDLKPKYVGRRIPNEFVVGYGLDYAERYRNLPYIGILKPEVYA